MPWEVNWTPAEEVKREHRSGGYNEDGWYDAAIQCEHCEDFASLDDAMEHARSVLPADFFGAVQVREFQTVSMDLGYVLVWDRTYVGEMIEVSD